MANIYRSAVTGQIVTKEYAHRNPDTTVAEVVLDPGEHDRGCTAARKLAAYYIGDASWADMIIEAYLEPEKAEQELAEEVGSDAGA